MKSCPKSGRSVYIQLQTTEGTAGDILSTTVASGIRLGNTLILTAGVSGEVCAVVVGRVPAILLSTT